ncbi:hypothetical protein OEZ85_008607 [Tetradesmus obliquus]|uniref:PX domain-containing protein n=1 Tax=Tetradesmus obliquus TaxID=3088 RepID=A0ABY8TL97_TETOB|nr:hypothetical protein OEZ85_008607 [Tetradesmus obliquus]
MLSLDSKDCIVYKVRVADDRGEWTVTRRYRHFEALHKRLKDAPHYKELPCSLPPKRLLTARDAPFVMKRRDELDCYLQALLCSSFLRSHPELAQFLEQQSELYSMAAAADELQGIKPAADVDVSAHRSRSDDAAALHSWRGVGGGYNPSQQAAGAHAAASQEGRRLQHVQQQEAHGSAPAVDRGVPGTKAPQQGSSSSKSSAGEFSRAVNAQPAGPAATSDCQQWQEDAADWQDCVQDSTGLIVPLYEVVSCAFELQNQGFVRRPVITLVRQLLSLVAGGTINEFLQTKLANGLSEDSISRQLIRLQAQLWPGGVWFARAAAAAAGSVPPKGPPINAEHFLDWTPPADCDEVAEQLRQRLIASTVPSPLLALLGKNAYMKCLGDIHGMMQSKTLMYHLGLTLVETVLVAMFPEINGTQELKSRGHVKSALQELLSGLDTCSRNAVKLRLQLAEYCILKCTTKAQLPALLPFLTKQGFKVLAKNRNDANCISALAALLASCLAKLLHEPSEGSYAVTHRRSGGNVDTAGTLCEVLLFPVIRSTYRDPEQARVAAGSEVLLALLEVLKAYAQQLDHAVEAMRMSLELMVQLLSMGTLAQRVPGVLLPLCTCLDVLGAGAGKDCIKRVLLLCLKGAVAKDVWQVRRDSVQTLAVLAACVMGLAAADEDAEAAGEPERRLLHTTPALRVLVMRKPQAVQVLEDARYDKIAAVRTAAAAALAKFSALPDPPKPAEAAAPAAPGTPSAAGGGGFSGSGRRSGKGSTAKERTRQPGSVLLRQTPGSRSDSAKQRRFARPAVPAGAVLDYGIQVFAPPSPPRRPTPTPASPQLAHSQGDAAREAGADQSPARRQLDFDAAGGKADCGSPHGLQASADAASQTCETCGPAHQTYTVQSPLSGVYAHPFGMAGGVPGSPHSAAGTGPFYPSDALQMMDQNQQQHGLAMLAAGAAGMGAARLDVNHHVHGRVELGIVSGSPLASPLRADAAGAAAFAAAGTEAMLAAAAAAAAAAAGGGPLDSMAGAAPGGAGQQQDEDGSVSVFSVSADGQQARRARQRWQLPSTEHLELATGTPAAAAGAAVQSPAAAHDVAFSDTASPPPYSVSPSRCSFKLADRSCSRQSSRSARDHGSSLEVLRNVGARVQGLLETLSRQTSGGGRGSSAGGAAVDGRSEDGAQEVSLGGAVPAAAAAAGGAAAGYEAASLADLLSSPGSEAGHQQREAQQQQQHEVVASPDTLTESYQLLDSLRLLSEDSRGPRAVETAGQPTETSDAIAEGDLAAAGTAAISTQLAVEPAADALQAAQHSLSSSGGGSPGLAQVEKALLKLQSLRSTLQSLGSSAASSRQQSLRGSRAISATGASSVCSPEASISQLPGVGSGSALANPGFAAAVAPSLEDAASSAALPAEQGDAAATSTREWIKQISQRIQQAGTGDTSTAAQLEAAMASLQAQRADIAAPAAAAAAAVNPGEPAALAGNQMLDASDDTALLLSLALKLDTLANKFRGQHTEAAASPSRLLGGRDAAASPTAITGMGPHSAAGDACSSDSQPEQWTHVRHNDLFVPLPSETAAATAGTGAAAAEQQQGQQLAALRPASPGGWAGEGSTDLALMPGSVDATASPTAQLAAAIDQRQVQDAVLQLVLGIGLQELHSGGLQAAAKVQQACAQLQQRLADYEQQPTAGLAHIGAQLSMQSGREMVQVQQQAAGLGLAAGSWSAHSSTAGHICQLRTYTWSQTLEDRMSSSVSLLMPCSSLERRCSEADAFDHLLGSPRACILEQLKSPSAASGGCGLKLAEQAAPKVPDVATMAKVRGSWHLAAVKKPAAAAVLMDLKVQRVSHGGPEGVKGVASQLITQHQLDDTFYVVDLANVVRLFKNNQPSARLGAAAA